MGEVPKTKIYKQFSPCESDITCIEQEGVASLREAFTTSKNFLKNITHTNAGNAPYSSDLAFSAAILCFSSRSQAAASASPFFVASSNAL